MKPQIALTGVLLAGGRSRRFGRNKAMIPWGGKRLIEAVVDLMLSFVPETLVLVKRPEEFLVLERPGVQVRSDRTSGHHPLGGIYSGLTYSRTERTFVCACDMPHLNPDLARALWGASADFDVTVPVWQDRPQPLYGIYSTRCLAQIEGMLSAEEYAVHGLFDRVRTRFFGMNEVRAIDPMGLSFIDVDTMEDYRRAIRVAGREDSTS